MQRLVNRFSERAKNRNPELEANLFELYSKDSKDSSIAQLLIDDSKYNATAIKETAGMREYIIKEGV
jgi:hypothetical protein